MVEVRDAWSPSVGGGSRGSKMHQRHGVRPTGNRENQRYPVSHPEPDQGGREARG